MGKADEMDAWNISLLLHGMMLFFCPHGKGTSLLPRTPNVKSPEKLFIFLAMYCTYLYYLKKLMRYHPIKG